MGGLTATRRPTTEAALSRSFIENEVLSLLTRLDQQQPFSMTMPMTPAASVADEALRAVTDHLTTGRRSLRHQASHFLRQVRSGGVADDQLQAGYALVKLRFNAILDQLDIFADVLSQRAEHQTGTWVAGLDVLATDALHLSANLYHPPPLMCFLDRGHGAAIRRARTRLPGGDENPVAVIQIPRERMIGSGIAASLIHEVGHQGAALLELVESLRAALRQRQARDNSPGWKMYDLWISEIIADVWAMCHLGIGATLGLMSVVSLPRYFMFRMQTDDPHPFPWIRVRLSIAFGKMLFPDRQWVMMEDIWQRLYPLKGLTNRQLQIIQTLEATMPHFVQLVIQHRNRALKQWQLHEVLPVGQRQPADLRRLYREWRQKSGSIYLAAPSLVFAVIGQARADSLISPQAESRLLGQMLNNWALQRSEDRSPRRELRTIREIEKIIS